MEEPSDEILTPKDLRQWLERELRDVLKGAELRIKDATDFVTAYAVGTISPEEVSERFTRYNNRWGDAIPRGVMTEEGMTNKEILHKVDAAASTAELRLRQSGMWSTKPRNKKKGRGERSV